LVETETQLIEQIQNNFISYFRLFAGLPGVTFVEENVTWFCNARGGEPSNFILRTQLDAETADDTVDEEIDRLLARIGKLTGHMDWLVFPTCRPTDLGRRLEARGMAGHRAGTWMTADLRQLPDAPAVPAGFTIQRVQDDAELWMWKLAQDAGFGGNAQIYYDAYARHGYGPAAAARHYVGFQDDRPVTSGTLLMSDGIASIYNVSTPPELRRRGYGSAITAHMMGEAIGCGYRMAWIWASDAGKGVYARLGFVEEDFGIREHTWHQGGNAD
jgi:ribosomal protein S18 acetylase RimI-like enzyme